MQTTDAPELFVEVRHRVEARPRIFEDTFAIFKGGLAEPIATFALPHRFDRDSRVTLDAHGWTLLDELELVPGPDVFRGRVAKAPVAYGHAGHWVSACVVDPGAGVPTETGFVAFGRCGTPLVEKTDTPRERPLCVGCTGDPVEMWALRDRIGWLADGGRPVKVLRALDHGDRVLMETETTDSKPREWSVVAPYEVLLAPEDPSTREEIAAGALVEAVVISNRPARQQWRVDRQPWGEERDTILTDGRRAVAVYTSSLRVLEQPAATGA